MEPHKLVALAAIALVAATPLLGVVAATCDDVEHYVAVACHRASGATPIIAYDQEAQGARSCRLSPHDADLVL